MRPTQLVMTAANPETGAVFCLVECEETAGSVSNNKDLEVVLLEMHCITKAHGIIKLSMCGDEEREDGVRIKGVQGSQKGGRQCNEVLGHILGNCTNCFLACNCSSRYRYISIRYLGLTPFILRCTF